MNLRVAQEQIEVAGSWPRDQEHQYHQVPETLTTLVRQGPDRTAALPSSALQPELNFKFAERSRADPPIIFYIARSKKYIIIKKKRNKERKEENKTVPRTFPDSSRAVNHLLSAAAVSRPVNVNCQPLIGGLLVGSQSPIRSA
ncbi:hypothetical protein PUN28_004931 [Cardiocondyla obscurior]|uniref:Uncharacterized protein n=1 Tax=Cardiocondyla obscurior TaxID=286306 RepID=A0AAW2GEZ3_9HYME